MTVRETLIAAKALIDTPDKWCQNAMSTDDGRCCMLGAVYRAAPDDDDRLSVWPLLQDATGCAFISEFNDSHTHAEVMAAFDRAIAACVTPEPVSAPGGGLAGQSTC